MVAGLLSASRGAAFFLGKPPAIAAPRSRDFVVVRSAPYVAVAFGHRNDEGPPGFTGPGRTPALTAAPVP